MVSVPGSGIVCEEKAVYIGSCHSARSCVISTERTCAVGF